MDTAGLLVPSIFPPVAAALPLAPTPPHDRFEALAMPSPASDDAGATESAPGAPSTPPSPPSTTGKPSTRSRGRGSASADGWAPRPPNAWILYRSDKSQELKRLQASRPEVVPMSSRQRQAEMSREISVLWKHESKSVKDHYARRAEKERADHRQRYPNYKYRPKRRAADASRSMYALRRHSSFEPLPLSLSRDVVANSRASSSLAGQATSATAQQGGDLTVGGLPYGAARQAGAQAALTEPYYIPSTTVAASYAPSTSIPAAAGHPGPASTVQLHRASSPGPSHGFAGLMHAAPYSPTFATDVHLGVSSATVGVPAGRSSLDFSDPFYTGARPGSQPGLSCAPFAFAPPPQSPGFNLCPSPLPTMGSTGVPMEGSTSSDGVSGLPAYTTTGSGPGTGNYDPSPFGLHLDGANPGPATAPGPAHLDTPLSLLPSPWHPAQVQAQVHVQHQAKWPEDQSPLSLHASLPGLSTSTASTCASTVSCGAAAAPAPCPTALPTIFPAGLVGFPAPSSDEPPLHAPAPTPPRTASSHFFP